MKTDAAMDLKAVNVLKGLVMDATRKANSGHPGGAMSSADFAYVLYKDFLNLDPDNTKWFNRDRFVLSAGHESMLLYGLLGFMGYLDVEDLKNFRQFGSRTPGHPEHHVTPGVEATTGPLGQGLSMAVGMAAAEEIMRHRLGEDICSHYTYVLASDGDMQEPVALGSSSLAGLWGLGKLIVLYDSNKIQLAGPTNRSDCTNYKTVFEGFCWHVQEIDGHDHDAIRRAIDNARLETGRPSLIICHTTIAKGTATREGDHETHGAPLPPDEIAATKRKLGLPENEAFHLPQDVLDHFRSRFPLLRDMAASWQQRLDNRQEDDAEFVRLWNEATRSRSGRIFGWPAFETGKKIATRVVWGKCLNALIDQLPLLAGGSADLDPSNMTADFRATVGDFGPNNKAGRNLPFGVREFPMGAIVNGMALHGGIIPFGATFLTFADYERNALRMSALQFLPSLHIFTHDSFYLGEDGPTHQPVEHISSLRLIPNMLVMRPAEALETCACLEIALTQDKRPTCLMLTRQGLPVFDHAAHGEKIKDGVRRGGYVLQDPEDGQPDLIIIATGSEVCLAQDAAAMLTGRKVRIVSMPCMELFDEQPEEYKRSVLPPEVTRRVAVEAGRPDLWHKYVGLEGIVLGMSTFGESAPAEVLAKEYGFTPENLVRLIQEKW